MTAIHVFDPAMCCSTGVCGPAIDPDLARFAADLDWLKKQGVSVERFNLAQQPGAFVADEPVKAALAAKGEAALPVVKVNGEVKSSGVYPSRSDLAAWAGITEKKATGCCGPKVTPPTKAGCCGPKVADTEARVTADECCTPEASKAAKSSGCC